MFKAVFLIFAVRVILVMVAWGVFYAGKDACTVFEIENGGREWHDLGRIMSRLSIQLPDGSEKTVVLPKNGDYFARIGRDEHCEISIPLQSVSGEHALLQSKDKGFVIEDLGSTNGVKINGLTPSGPAVLYDGDEIMLGDARLLFVEEPASVPAPSGGVEARVSDASAGFSPVMHHLQAMADSASRTARRNYFWMGVYAILMFVLAVFAGLTYKHYKTTGEMLPLQWLGIESPKAALKAMEQKE